MRIAGLHRERQRAYDAVTTAELGRLTTGWALKLHRETMSEDTKPKVNPRRYSSEVVDGLKQAPSRAMLRAVGYKDADFKKPAIGIASTWSNLTPCNMHIDKLARAAAARGRQGGRQEHDVRHDHGFRRHLERRARHALFARVARGHCGLDRDRLGRAGLRWRRRDRRLRQEHARLPDGARAARIGPRCSSTAARSGPARNSATSSPCSRRAARSPAARSPSAR